MHAPLVIVMGLEPDVGEALSHALARHGWGCVRPSSAEHALELIDANEPDLFVCDLGAGEGAIAARVLLACAARVPVIGVTDDEDAPLARQAQFHGWPLAPRSPAGAIESVALAALAQRLDRPPTGLSAAVPVTRHPIPPFDPDFQRFLDSQRANDLVLTPQLSIAAVSRAYGACTGISSAQIGGMLFEVFPDNPDDPSADGVRNLDASLRRAAASGQPDAMRLQRYDIRLPHDSGSFVERWWLPVNYPVLRDGRLQYLVHRVEDVTRFVKLRQHLQAGAAGVLAGASSRR